MPMPAVSHGAAQHTPVKALNMQWRHLRWATTGCAGAQGFFAKSPTDGKMPHLFLLHGRREPTEVQLSGKALFLRSYSPVEALPAGWFPGRPNCVRYASSPTVKSPMPCKVTRAQPFYFLPKSQRMVHVPAMWQFMQDDVIPHLFRRLDQPPVQRNRPTP